jgi:hypothetical protein
MTEVNLKCERCGFPAVMRAGPTSNFDFIYPKEIYTICPVVTERLDNEQAGVKPLDCPDFQKEVLRAKATIPRSS